MAAARSIAILDDDGHQAAVTGLIAEEAGFEPVLATGERYPSPNAVVSKIENVARAALCDHRLAPLGLGYFTGAEVVAALNRDQFPAVLVTQFQETDADVSIRRWRRNIPVVLTRDAVEPDAIAHAVQACLKEFRGDIPKWRRPYRTLVRVNEVTSEAGESVLDVTVPGWNPRVAVRFPLALVPEALRALVRPGARLIAAVNVGARSADELYFDNFEPTAEPPEGVLGG